MELEKLRQSSQFRLLNFLSSISPNKKKDISIHETLMKPLDQVVGVRLLREHGIEKLFKMSTTEPAWKNDTRIYFIPSSHSAAVTVVRQIKAEKSHNINYHVIIVPKVLHILQDLFESYGILDQLTLHSFSWDFIPLDTNLISLEMEHFFRDSFVHGDDALLSSISKAILSFECLFGVFPSITTLGKKAATVHKLLAAWHHEIQPPFPEGSEFNHLIVIDRNIDLAALLLTQLTYEGVLDENFKIKCGFVTLNPDGKAEETQRLMLHSGKDEIYSEIQGKHISAVFHHLSGKAKQLQCLSEKKNTTSVMEMKQFVSHDLKQIQKQQKSLALHISACEIIMKRQGGVLEELLSMEQNIMGDSNTRECLLFLEDAMARCFNREAVIRLLCLYSLLQDGYTEKEFKFYFKQFLQAYGYQQLPVLHNLQLLGLFTAKESKLLVDPHIPDKLAKVVNLVPGKPEIPSFRKICRKLNLEPDGKIGNSEQLREGQHPSYVYGGSYVPLIYRFVEKIIKDREPSLDEFARLFGNDLRSSLPSNNSLNNQGRTMVLFLGGVTLAEVAALSLLSRQLNRFIAIATTSTISASTFIEALSSQM